MNHMPSPAISGRYGVVDIVVMVVGTPLVYDHHSAIITDVGTADILPSLALHQHTTKRYLKDSQVGSSVGCSGVVLSWDHSMRGKVSYQ